MNFSDQHWLLTPAEIQAADQAYVVAGGDSWQLMQHAGKAVSDHILNNLPCRPLHIFCGPGNNGADGLVVANNLRHVGWPVRVSRLGSLPGSVDGAKAVALWNADVPLADPARLPVADYYVDALFGAGLNRDLDGAALALVQAINKSGRLVIAIDIPSGVDGANGRICGDHILAEHTVTFFRAKPGHWLMPGRDACGDLVVRQIGLQPDHIADHPQIALNNPDIWRALVPSLNVQHKYKRGRLWIAGGKLMTGAACLSASAGLQAGAGLVGIVAHSCVGPIYRMRERALIVADADTPESFDALLREKKTDAMVIGPGFGRRNDTKELVSMVLSLTDRAVLDADALTAFAADPNELFAQMTTNHVLTPHEGEFTRLFPDLKGTRIEQAREAAQRCGAIMVLKGRDTLIAHPNGAVIINANAPNNLAMGGSGDVLAGIIGGLLARGMGQFMAAAAGVWFHGEAGKLAGNGAIADDLLDHLKAVIG